MVQAMINIEKHTNWVLNIIKAKYDLKTKSQAINFLACNYEENFLEPELRPEYIEKAKKVMKQKALKVGTVSNLRKKLEV
tara:strand:- start:134 stop:373 length:240 start_codon:yes stop_codon:yes gene_type:complete